MLSLSFESCISCCPVPTLSLTDTTLPTTQNNPNGWGCPNVAIIDIASAIITVYVPYNSGSPVSYDVTAQITSLASITGVIKFDPIELTTYQDGLIRIDYTITTVLGDVFTQSTMKLSLCHIRKCIDKKWVKVAEAKCSNCCDNSIVAEAEMMENLYQALVSASACYDENVINNLLEKLNILCNNNNCGCN